MKKTLINIFLGLLLISIGSCSGDWLNLEPSDSIPADEALVNFAGLNVARIGLYDGLQGTSRYTSYYAARMIYYGDVRGDDMQACESGKRTSVLYEMKYTADDAPNMWNVQYNVIRRANRIIEAVENNIVKGDNQDEIKGIYAEALVVRALVHFDLVRVYGQTYTADNGASLGVPIELSPKKAGSIPARNTVKEVYDQVVKDLQKAINDGFLTKKITTGYINHWVAKALLSRVYLYMGDNDKALKEAEEVIEQSPYKLWTNEEYVSNVWSKDNPAHSKEIIFEIINASTDDWTDREGIAYLYNEDGYADAIATKSFCELLQSDPNDARLTAMLASSDDDLKKTYGDDKVWVNKFPANNMGEMRLNNVPLIRLSEIYLIAAETAFKLGKKVKADKYTNAIALRANPKQIPLVNVNLERIIIEKRKELVGEGHRFFDAMRNNETIVRYESVENRGYHYVLSEKESMKFDRTYYRTILPIPKSEMDVNPTLKGQQNPGY